VDGDDIEMDLRERRWAGMDWIDVAEDSDRVRVFVKTVNNLPVP
jgi:hypothetical protein